MAFLANVLVFPMMLFFLNRVNHSLLRWNFYEKSAIWVARRAKGGSEQKIQKYGFWGLLFFVMLPIPGTGVYAGSIATYLFNIEKKKAFYANMIGIFLSICHATRLNGFVRSSTLYHATLLMNLFSV